MNLRIYTNCIFFLQFFQPISDSERKALEIIAGYSHPKDNKPVLVNLEVNEKFSSSGKYYIVF